MRASALVVLLSALTGSGPSYPSPVSASSIEPQFSPERAPVDVELAPYGQLEDSMIFVSSGFKAVRFDPPFAPPYTITSVRFPSFTRSGATPVFPSIRLVEFDLATGQLKWDTPLLNIAPYSGSADGVNEVPVNAAVADSGKVFLLCVEFPPTGGTIPSNDFPLLRADLRSMERGLFNTSFDLNAVHGITRISNYNVIASMVCQLSPEASAPPSAPANVRMNWRQGYVDFTYSMLRRERHRIARVDLLQQLVPGKWKAVASSEAGSPELISVPTLGSVLLFAGAIFAVQAVDENGQRSEVSDAVGSEFGPYDDHEPNGSLEEAAVSPVGVLGSASIYAPGDQDFFEVWARPGDVISAYAASTWPFPDGMNDLDLVAFLFDERGRIVASDDNSRGFLDPSITYRVRPASVGAGVDARRFTVLFADRRGSRFSSDIAPVVLDPLEEGYVFSISVSAVETRKVAGTTGLWLTLERGASDDVVLRYAVPVGAESSPATIRIFDVRGRLLRTLKDTAGPLNRATTWDRTDGSGHRVATGIYYARVDAAESRAVAKVVITR